MLYILEDSMTIAVFDFQQCRSRTSARDGFTVIEVMVVVVVIAILATVVAVSYNSARIRSHNTEREADIMTAKQAVEKYYSEHGTYPRHTGSGSMQDDAFLTDKLKLPVEATVSPEDKSTGSKVNSFTDNFSATNNYAAYGYRAYTEYFNGAPCVASSDVCKGYKFVYKKRGESDYTIVAGGTCNAKPGDINKCANY